MNQDRMERRFTPARGNGLMYTPSVTGESEHREPYNIPAGEQMRRNNVQRDAEGNTNVFGFNSPPPINFDTEEMRGSMQLILSKNVGEYVVVEFLIGTTMIVRKQGILYYVGTSYITLYDNQENNFIVCDLYSIKFVYFYFPGDRPDFNFNVLRDEATMVQNTGDRRQQNMRR